VKQYANGYVSNRVLKLNVGFLLTSGPGHSNETVFDVPAIRVSDDVDVSYIRGPVRLSRTKEGILVQSELHVGIEDECYRCLEPVSQDVPIVIEELYAYPMRPDAEYGIGEDAILDLAPLLREEVVIATARGMVCQPDCKGLCPECGANLNHTQCSCGEVEIDPRLAKLKELLDAKK
jgi:uncharacterized protein